MEEKMSSVSYAPIGHVMFPWKRKKGEEVATTVGNEK